MSLFWDRNEVNGNGVSSFQRYSSFSSGHVSEDVLTSSNRRVSSSSNVSINQIDKKMKNPPPAPPMPPKLPVTPIATSVSSTPNGVTQNDVSNRRSVTEATTPVGNDMHRELKEVLTLFREKKRNIEINKTPDIFITQTSNPTEVQNWLKAKSFSENAQQRLKGLSGNEIFALKKETLEEYCGPEEGKRLSSQITVQRNVSGYKTTRSSELLGILAKVRQKTEGLNGVQELEDGASNHVNESET